MDADLLQQLATAIDAFLTPEQREQSKDQSLEYRFALLPPAVQQDLLGVLTDDDLMAFEYDWGWRGRPKQQEPPGDWFMLVMLTGRGAGKTITGANWVQRWAETGTYPQMLIAGPTKNDVLNTMIDGPSGIMAIAPPWFRPTHEPSKLRLVWPNGTRALTFSAEEPERFRGPQYHRAWLDEVAAWSHPESLEQIKIGLRLPPDPRAIVTTTPKPLPHIVELVRNPRNKVIYGSTYENLHNLSDDYYRNVIAPKEGTRLYRQEIMGELLLDVEGALWSRKLLDDNRVQKAPEFRRVVVAIDPATTTGENSDETGIVVAGLGYDGHGYVIDDRSGKYSPDEWGRTAVYAYHRFYADRIVAETNNGGDMVGFVIRQIDPRVPYRKVTATRGKRVRAEPIAALYEKGMVHHVGGLPELEDQLVTWAPDQTNVSPDRLDALVWALYDLMLVSRPRKGMQRVKADYGRYGSAA